ncbi:hypothetical protein BJX64DRAFT_254528 [Aspergillus heterothallicus]
MTSALSPNEHHYTNTRHEPLAVPYWQPILRASRQHHYFRVRNKDASRLIGTGLTWLLLCSVFLMILGLTIWPII